MDIGGFKSKSIYLSIREALKPADKMRIAFGGISMKVPFVAFFLVVSAIAQSNSTPIGAPGCGDPQIKFDVKTNKSQHPDAQPASGKALVYFLEDDDAFESFPKPTTRIGVDGVWVGANHGDSYLSFAIDPGEHHLCASWQSFVALGSRETSGAAHFTAEAGNVLI
jgi:hypothetical protein